MVYSEKVLFITGAGAVENAWNPIIDVYSDYYGFEINADGANFELARAVYLLRFYATSPEKESEQSFKDFLEGVNQLKRHISISLKGAEENDRIRPRAELAEILDKFVVAENHRSVILSTNWDTVIDNVINKLLFGLQDGIRRSVPVLHLHGSILEHDNLYLPSEVVREPYRTDEQLEHLRNLHAQAISAVKNATKSILYGLSLDPLDAELSQVLSIGWASRNHKEIIIINPNYEVVAKRFKLLVKRNYSPKIIAYDPRNLHNPIYF